MNGDLTIKTQRVRRSRAEADAVAAEYESGGLGRMEFCQRKGIAINTLARYVTRRRREQSAPPPSARWVAVEVSEPEPGTAGLAVIVSGGRRIEVGRGFDPETLRRLVSALEQV